MPDDESISLSRFAPTALASRRAAHRLDQLLSAQDAEARVAALQVQDLYALVQEIGIGDAYELLALATPEQVQGLIDIDTWRADRLDDRALVPWLDALIAAGPERLTATWRGLDSELTALLLQRWVRIYNIIEEEVPDWEEPPFIPTPDRFFMLKITAEDPEVIRLVGELIDRIYRADAPLARHTIRSAASEPAAELEETALRWRSGRMQDLGYADPLEALEVYQPIDVASVQIGENTAETAPTGITLPAVLAEPALKQPFLRRVLERVTDAPLADRLEATLVLLLNRVLAADRVSPSDPVGTVASASAATARLSLGLETVARGDEARGEAALRTIALVRLHRIGHSVIRKLADAARVLAPRAARCEEPYLSVLTALTRARPELARVLDYPPDIGTRPFAQVADVRTATQALGIVAAQVTIVQDGFGIDPALLGPAVTLGDVARTAIVHYLLGDGLKTTPMDAESVRRFAASLEGGALPTTAEPALRAAFAAVLEQKKIGVPQEFAGAIGGWIRDLERELGQLDSNVVPETRFVGGLLVQMN